MKVIQLITSRQFRGAEIFALQLTRNLSALDVTVKWVALYPPPEKEITPADIDWLELSGNRNSILDWGLVLRFKNLVKEFRPDIIQANAGDTLKYVVLLKLLFGFRFKIIFRNASMVSLYMQSTFQRTAYSILYRYTDQVISVSEHSKADFIKTFPSISGRIQVIPNGLTIGTSPVKLKAFNSADINIVHVAGFSFEKNHLRMLHMFNLIKERMPSVKLWLIGDGPLREVVQQRIVDMNLKNVVLAGVVDNPLDYISSAHVLVLPSIIEGLPGVVLEAMYCRTPVVAYEVGGIAEVLKTGETGWLVKANDEGAFVKSVLEVLQAKEQVLIPIKDNAYNQVVSCFDNRAIAKRFLEVYSNL